MTLVKLVCALLDSRGLDYAVSGDTVQLILQAGYKKWSAVFTDDKEGFLRYYARYPWRVSEADEGRVLALLNRLNTQLRAGCFLLSEGYPVFRYGVYIFDEFTAAESAADLMVTAMAKTAAAWDDIQKAASV